ncbi:MAG: inositol monophosphatase [Cyclobacteriaceae bacterium]|nr:inositol monophosphatase [Cyclobacteriaceae bacterium]UYN86511.1 MAG: inositol monophosphatase [Cyclobacteriaceae bacterium]
MIQLAHLEKEVIRICREVGAFIRKEATEFDRSKIEFKTGFNNLVSYVDKEAEIQLVRELKKLIPSSTFITEEGTVQTNTGQEYCWIIDPLDGTTNFMHGLPTFAISVALAQNNKVVLGVVYEVMHDECFHTFAGGLAACNGKPIQVSSITTLSESLLATGFPYYHLDKKDVYLEIIKVFLEQTHGIRRLGSAAIDLAYVSCGRMDGFFEYNLNPWDVAAGAFIVQQAGGRVTDFSGGNNFLHGGEIIAAGAVQQQMLQVINELWYKK